MEDAATAGAKDGDVVAVDAAADGGTGSSFTAVRATLAPPGTTKWSLGGLSFEAPSGQNIVAALVADVDGDGQRDVIAYVQPPGGGGGELRFFRGGASGLAASKAVVGTISGVDVALPSPCLGKPQLTLVGPHSVTLELHPACGAAAPASRKLIYAAFAPTPSIRWAARIVEPPAGLTFEIETESVDRPTDGDGIDDPTFRFSLAGNAPPLEPSDPVVARLRYWDRASGMPRDRQEPEASFQLMGNRAEVLARKKLTAKQTAPFVKRLRLLYAALCKEGSPWLEPGGERGVDCGPSLGVHLGTIAQARAALTLGDVLDAAGLREHVAGNSAWPSSKQFSALDNELRRAANAQTASLREITAAPSTPSKGAPAWGALAFEPSGALLVRTVTSVTRVETSGAESEATGVLTWPWEVTWAGLDARLVGASASCDAPWTVARVAGHDVPTGSASSPLPLLPRLDRSRCSDGRAPALPVLPIAWGDDGLIALVDGELAVIAKTFGAPGSQPVYGSPIAGAYVRGSPRSPNGNFLVVPTRHGILRRDEASGAYARIVQPALEGLYVGLRECTVSNDGNRVACVRDGRAILLDLGSAPTPAPTPAPSVSASASAAEGETM